MILCLPDDAAREAVSLIENDAVKVIDASTAYRVAPDWAYGFPEMSKEQRGKIAASKRISNPGCYPTAVQLGFLPLLERCLGTPGVHVIDCPVDYSENDRILNVELRERALAV